MVSTDLFFLFFTILYHLLDRKMVSDRFWMIYGIDENPRPTGKRVKYTPGAWGLKRDNNQQPSPKYLHYLIQNR